MEVNMELPHSPKATIRKRKREAACLRCHSYKIKCSGERPCQSCATATNKVDCVYPVKDRKIQISERYLRELRTEVELLRARTEQTGTAVSTSRSAEESNEATRGREDVILTNPLVADHPQLVGTQEPARPVYLGDASGIAFGMKLRQLVRRHQGESDTLQTRHRYFQSRVLLRTRKSDYPLPEKPYALVLVEIVKRFLGATHHLRLGADFMARLDRMYDPGREDPTWVCRLFLIFALGELYSNSAARVPQDSGRPQAPGTSYFLTAMSLLQDAFEEANVAYVETLMLAVRIADVSSSPYAHTHVLTAFESLYSDALNRTNSAYAYIGLALRVSLTLGLHRDISSNMPPAEREHRRRVWWTVHYLERLCSSKLGHPMMLRDEDISTGLPSCDGLSDAEKDEFPPPAILIAQIELAKIVGMISSDLYCVSRAEPRQSFSHSVQSIFSRLKQWNESLPIDLDVDSTRHGVRSISSLYLLFNQCVILTTRPILFFVFQLSSKKLKRIPPGLESSRQDKPDIPPMAVVLAKHCIHAAQNIHKILMQLWIEGLIGLSSYPDALILFTSTMVLMLSTELETTLGETDQRDRVTTMCRLLESMRDHGNAAAAGFYEQLELLRQDLGMEHLGSTQKATGEGSGCLANCFSAVSSPTHPVRRTEDTNLGCPTRGMSAAGSLDHRRLQPGLDDPSALRTADVGAVATPFYSQGDSLITTIPGVGRGEEPGQWSMRQEASDSIPGPDILGFGCHAAEGDLSWDWSLEMHMDDMNDVNFELNPFLWR